MKSFILINVLILVCAAGFSQPGDIWKRKPWETLKKDNLAKLQQGIDLSLIEKQNKKKVQPFVVKIDIELKKAGSANNGSELYTVEPYKMPCAAPGENFRSNMPVRASGFSER